MIQNTKYGVTISASGSRHHNEVYGAVIDERPGNTSHAWLRVDGAAEALIIKNDAASEETTVDKGYIVSPAFAAGFLIWTRKAESGWVVRAYPATTGGKEVFTPFSLPGRVSGITSCTARKTGNAVLAFEYRTGKRTSVGFSFADEKGFSDPVFPLGVNYNLYDPAIACAPDGTICCFCSAFTDGNYRSVLFELDPSFRLLREPVIADATHGACHYPSLWYDDIAEGFLFSFAAFDVPVENEDISFVRHDRRRAQRMFFSSGRSRLYAGVFRQGKISAIDTGHNSCSLRIPQTEDCGHARIFRDTQGTIHILFRKSTGAQAGLFPDRVASDLMAPGDTLPLPTNTYPSISCISLDGRKWMDPLVLVPRAHFDAPVTFNEYGGIIRAAFTVDGRMTGWNTRGEWFDTSSKLAVGVLEYAPSFGASEINAQAFNCNPVLGPSIEEPRINPRRRFVGRLSVFGQTHTHSFISVCQRGHDRSPELNYRFAQDVQHLDFCGITDHDYNMWHTEMVWMNKLADFFYFPGEFVSFPAYEWTGSDRGSCTHDGGPFGHVNPLYLEETGALDVFTPVENSNAGATLTKLWETHRGKQIITPPHHVADRSHPYNWSFFDAEFIPVIELFQDFRGSGEAPDAPGLTNYSHDPVDNWALSRLLEGKRFGFIGGADHSGVAIAGVHVRELTRTGIYEALSRRQCFALTGHPVHVDFRCNGKAMGSSLRARFLRFECTAEAGEIISEIQVLRKGKIEKKIQCSNNICSCRFSARRRESGEFWYIRIILQNGEMAWTSPIWID